MHHIVSMVILVMPKIQDFNSQHLILPFCGATRQYSDSSLTFSASSRLARVKLALLTNASRSRSPPGSLAARNLIFICRLRLLVMFESSAGRPASRVRWLLAFRWPLLSPGAVLFSSIGIVFTEGRPHSWSRRVPDVAAGDMRAFPVGSVHGATSFKPLTGSVIVLASAAHCLLSILQHHRRVGIVAPALCRGKSSAARRRGQCC